MRAPKPARGAHFCTILHGLHDFAWLSFYLLAPRLLQGRATAQQGSKQADTVGTALQSHSVGVGLAICFDAGACDRRKSGGVQRAGRSAIQDWQ